MLDTINAMPWFPITGVRNGKPDPDAQKTVRWADRPVQRLDGKWVFPRIPEARLDQFGVSQQLRQQILNLFKPVIEERQPGQFANPAEE